jgi:septal ring factor EnvC (AmiA/AmiB activator)
MSVCPLLCGAKWEEDVFNPNCCACMFELGQTLDDEGLDEKQPLLESLWKTKTETDEARMKRIEVNYKAMQDKLKAAETELQAAQAELEATRVELEVTRTKLKASEANLKPRFLQYDIVL